MNCPLSSGVCVRVGWVLVGTPCLALICAAVLDEGVPSACEELCEAVEQLWFGDSLCAGGAVEQEAR